MNFRGSEKHGLFPYLGSLFNDESGIRDSFFNFYYSFIFGIFATVDTLKKAVPDWNVIFVSLNPLPGTMVGWYEISDEMRLNIYAPFTLHGRIFTMGYMFTIIYFFITGAIFTFIDKTIRKSLKKKNKGLPFVLVILAVLHIIYGFEYNMRSAVRYIYYSLFIIFLVFIFKTIYNFLLNLNKVENDK